MMKYQCRQHRVLWLAFFFTAVCVIAQGQKTQRPTLTVGWQDEFNTLEGWTPWTASGGADILSGMDGTLRVRLGKSSDYLRDFKHYRAGVWKEFEVDLNRYPIFVVHATRFRNGSSWDVALLEYRDKDSPHARDTSFGGDIPVPGNPDRSVADRVSYSGVRTIAETVFMNVEQNRYVKRQGKSRVRLLLNLSGTEQGGFLDCGWARFLTIEEAERFRKNPHAPYRVLVNP